MADATKTEEAKKEAAVTETAPPADAAQVRITLDETSADAAYSNFCRVTGTPEEVIIDFALNPNPFSQQDQNVKIDKRLVLNHYTAKRLFAALQHLRHNKHEVIIFHVVDKKTEMEFDFPNRPLTFIDLESGEEVKANPVDVRENYLSQMAAFHSDLKIRCGQYQIDFVEADVNDGVNPILLEYMLKRQKLY